MNCIADISEKCFTDRQKELMCDYFKHYKELHPHILSGSWPMIYVSYMSYVSYLSDMSYHVMSCHVGRVIYYMTVDSIVDHDCTRRVVSYIIMTVVSTVDDDRTCRQMIMSYHLAVLSSRVRTSNSKMAKQRCNLVCTSRTIGALACAELTCAAWTNQSLLPCWSFNLCLGFATQWRYYLWW